MEELIAQVDRARRGDLEAYGELVQRFQDMAAGYAYALLGDFHLAQDAAQEAFVQAYLDLDRLREPAAFPGWLRRIVFKQCDRLRRRKSLPVVSLETVGEPGAAQRGADELLEIRETRDLGIQRLLRQVDQKDCVVALKGASPAVREKILGNMSQRVRTFIEEEMEARGELPEEEIRRAQQLMVDLLRQFHYPGVKLDKEHRDRKRKVRQVLRDRPFGQMTFDELTDLFKDLAKIASLEGPLAVEEFLDAIPEERAGTDRDALLFVSGLRRGIMGSGREMIDEILEKRMRQLLQEHETRCRMIIDGVASLAERATPDYMMTRLRAYYAMDGY